MGLFALLKFNSFKVTFFFFKIQSALSYLFYLWVAWEVGVPLWIHSPEQVKGPSIITYQHAPLALSLTTVDKPNDGGA